MEASEVIAAPHRIDAEIAKLRGPSRDADGSRSDPELAHPLADPIQATTLPPLLPHGTPSASFKCGPMSIHID
jgi:hypothetical protein